MAWLPPSLAVTYVVGMILWGMFNSQQKRIEKALKGTKGNVSDELGFMNKIKTEVKMSIYLYQGCGLGASRTRCNIAVLVLGLGLSKMWRVRLMSRLNLHLKD